MTGIGSESYRRAVTVVGIGDDGCCGLTSRALNAVARAQLLVGGERHLAFFPEFAGERLVVNNGIGAALDRIQTLAQENNVCVLASGDPLFFGIGGLVIHRVGAEHVEVLPHPSSVQWAFARVGMKWDDALFLSLHGRNGHGLVTRLRQHRKAAILTDPTNSPSAIARKLVEYSDPDWDAWVCENLGGTDERVRRFTINELSGCDDIGALNVLILARSDSAWSPPQTIPFLHEDLFAKRMPKKGLITKREVRLLSLASMGIRRNSVIWDIGAGSGSVSIEAALLAPEGDVYAVEVDPEGIEICRENLLTHSVDNVTVVEGRAPEALDTLPAPDSVFVGGSKGSMREIVDYCIHRLQPGGHLVVNAITLENSAEAYEAFRAQGLTPEVTLLQISRAEPLARYRRYEALNPIQVFSVRKPEEGKKPE
ncbi:MAG TPA: precorrin-6y C5,15-methyltransferase (decarboxylating) subunit CbiE [Candidatus Angelobacter sp.]|nr:precorrin-6y C5,15-methyltransferase (decarboxylating) subunit CbiE [Candidatus Angelobacter sp.]